jgi:beta-lactam-binding protein with PASTA domain
VRCKVPKLKGLTLSKAKARLKKANCRLGKTTKKKSRVRKGRVIAQAPKSGSVRRSGTRVNVVLSRGR